MFKRIDIGLLGPPRSSAGTSRSNTTLVNVKLPCFLRRYHHALNAGEKGIDGAHLGGTDSANRLGHLVKALAKAPASVMEALSRDWVPLLLEYAAAHAATPEPEPTPAAGVAAEAAGRGDESSSAVGVGGSGVEAVETAVAAAALEGGAVSRIGGKAWRAQLAEWLAFLAALKGARGVYRWVKVCR